MILHCQVVEQSSESRSKTSLRGMSGLYWGYIGIIEKKMETTIMGYIGYILVYNIGVLGAKVRSCSLSRLR